MKKLTMLLLVLVICSAAVFADDYGFSVGGGFSFVFNYTTATQDWTSTGLMGPSPDESTKQTIKEFNYGGFIFFDAKYVEFVVTAAGGPSDIDVEFPYPISADDSFRKNSFNMSFGIFGKYPFKLGPVVIFPLAGIDYVVYLIGTYPNDQVTTPSEAEGVHRNVAGDFNSLWFKFGGGVDIPIQEKLFVRIEALYGFALENKFQKNGEDEAKNNPAMKGSTDWGWVNGPTIRIGLGYRF